MTEVVAYIGLGSNLDNPRNQVSTAVEEMAATTGCRLGAVSSLYRSPPMGPADQPDYVNAVAQIGTSLSAEALLDVMQALEDKHQRVRSRHWGPRTLDLDILLYGDEVIRTPRLQVPHPGIAERSFVLYPLSEIGATLDIPGVGTVADLVSACPRAGLERIEDTLKQR